MACPPIWLPLKLAPVPEGYLDEVKESLKPENQEARLKPQLEAQAAWYKHLQEMHPLPAGMAFGEHKIDCLIVERS